VTSEIPDLPAHVRTAGIVRSFVHATLAVWGLPDLIDVAQLVASELVTNSVVVLTDPETKCRDHPPGVPCERCAEYPYGLPREIGGIPATLGFGLRAGMDEDGAHVLIGVEDPGDGVPVLTTTGPEAESGRGLEMVAAVSEEWGWVPCGGGKLTWARLEQPTLAAVKRR
jgi:hypothetical protein